MNYWNLVIPAICSLYLVYVVARNWKLLRRLRWLAQLGLVLTTAGLIPLALIAIRVMPNVTDELYWVTVGAWVSGLVLIVAGVYPDLTGAKK